MSFILVALIINAGILNNVNDVTIYYGLLVSLSILAGSLSPLIYEFVADACFPIRESTSFTLIFLLSEVAGNIMATYGTYHDYSYYGRNLIDSA